MARQLLTLEMAKAAAAATRQESRELMEEAREYRDIPGFAEETVDAARYWRRIAWRFDRMVEQIEEDWR